MMAGLPSIWDHVCFFSGDLSLVDMVHYIGTMYNDTSRYDHGYYQMISFVNN